jgi:hypothetical protein
MPELRVRRRAVGDRTASPSHYFHVALIHPHAVDQERSTIERATCFEQSDWRSCARRGLNPATLPTFREISGAVGNEVDLGLTLGDVHREGQLP